MTYLKLLRYHLVALALLALLLVWAGSWWMTLRLTEAHIKAWASQSPSHFQATIFARGGTPFVVELLLGQVRWQTNSGLVLQAPKLRLRLAPLNFWRYELASNDGVTITAGDTKQSFVLDARTLDAELTLNFSGYWRDFRSALQQIKLTADAAAILTTEQLELRLQQPDTPPEDHTVTGLNLMAAIASARFAPDFLPSLQQEITALTLNLKIMGRPPDWRRRDAVMSWRDAGGTAELDGLDFNWGRLSGQAKGTLALDQAMQPQGSGTVRLALDPNVAGNEPEIVRNTLNLIFGAFAKTNTAGMKSVTLPLALQNRQLALGILPLGQMPVLNWPENR
jgi:hypothetical protein